MNMMMMMKKRKVSSIGWMGNPGFVPRSVQICRKKIKKGGKLAAGIIEVLPEELVEEILLRLPLKSIILSGCVCKSWYSLIRTRNFISTHLHKTKSKFKSKSNNSEQLFLFDSSSAVNPSVVTQNQISLIFNTPSPDHQLDYRLLHLPVGVDPLLISSFAVVDSVNGIVCLHDLHYSSYFILSNPSIRHSILLPLPQFVPLDEEMPTCRGILGFGFDDINHDYKIIRILKSNSHNHWSAQLYSLNLNCWRDILVPIPNFDVSIDRFMILAAFVNGRFHWVVKDENDNTNLIMVFDLKEETFHYLSLPKSLPYLSQVESLLKVVPFRRESSIVLTQEEWVKGAPVGVPPLWLMREYGAAGSWQSLTHDELEESIFGCPPKDVNQKFLKIIQPSRHSLHAHVPSLDLLDIQRLQY